MSLLLVMAMKKNRAITSITQSMDLEKMMSMSTGMSLSIVRKELAHQPHMKILSLSGQQNMVEAIMVR